jgi:hypothetical protein
MTNERVFAMSFAGVYPHYVKKVETKGPHKGRARPGHSLADGIHKSRPRKTDREEDQFPRLLRKGARSFNPNASLIKGVVCGIRVEDIEDPLMQKIRYLDKLIDELAKGKKMEKILRTPE